MKIAIFGTGAMGSVYAGLFREAGHEVWAVDPWAEHIARIRACGLQLDGASGNRRIEGIQSVTEFADVGACDLVVIATKAAGVGPAAKAIAPTCSVPVMDVTRSWRPTIGRHHPTPWNSGSVSIRRTWLQCSRAMIWCCALLGRKIN